MIHNFGQIDRFLGSLKRKSERKIYTNIFRIVIGLLEDAHEFFFQEEVSPYNRPWTPLAESTKLRKGHDRILYETGDLMDSLTQKTGYSIREGNYRSGAMQIEFGTRIPYAQYHQHGDGVPVRQHVGMDRRLADIITRKAMDTIMENLI